MAYGRAYAECRLSGDLLAAMRHVSFQRPCASRAVTAPGTQRSAVPDHHEAAPAMPPTVLGRSHPMTLPLRGRSPSLAATQFIQLSFGWWWPLPNEYRQTRGRCSPHSRLATWSASPRQAPRDTAPCRWIAGITYCRTAVAWPRRTIRLRRPGDAAIGAWPTPVRVPRARSSARRSCGRQEATVRRSMPERCGAIDMTRRPAQYLDIGDEP